MVDPNLLKSIATMTDEDREEIRNQLRKKPLRGLRVHFKREQKLKLGPVDLWAQSVGKERIVLTTLPPDQWKKEEETEEQGE